MPRRFGFMTAIFMFLPNLMMPMPAASAQASHVGDCDPTGIFVDVPLDDLVRLSKVPRDPFADGMLTGPELAWMRQYEEVTGDTYDSGDFDQLRAVVECIEGSGSVTSGASASASARIDEGDDRVCRTTAREWAAEFSMSPEAIAVLSGCRQDAQGAWFFPTGPDDPRLPAPILTPEEEQQTAALRTEIEMQLAGLDATMPYWMPEELDRLYEPDKHPVSGHRDPDQNFGVLRPQYEEILIAYLRDPSRVALADYANWWFNRREAAVPAATCSSMPPPICNTMRVRLGYVGIGPWPWDLEDPLTRAEYLDWALANSRVPLPPAAAPTMPPAMVNDQGQGDRGTLEVRWIDAAGRPVAAPGG